MIVEIDFNSEEALYIQLINQIIIGIATDQIREGDTLPSVRQLADNIGINMHTVNKAYSVLKQEGFLRVDRRRGAVIALDTDKMRTISEMRRDLSVILARGVCKNVSRRGGSQSWWIPFMTHLQRNSRFRLRAMIFVYWNRCGMCMLGG